MRNAYLRYLNAMFNWALMKGYLESNPVARVESASVQRGEVQIYSVNDVQRLLDDCLEADLELLPYRVLTIFCGIRPGGEMSRLQWADVSFEERVVKLRSEITKKGRTRTTQKRKELPNHPAKQVWFINDKL